MSEKDYTDEERDLLELAYPYALEAVSDPERAEIAHRLENAAPQTAHEFARIVADTHETMSRVGDTDALAPPPDLRDRIISALEDLPAGAGDDELSRRRELRRRRWIRTVAAAAAVVVVAVGVAVGVGEFTDRSPTVPTIAQIVNSPDAHTVTAEVAGGLVTVKASEQENALVVAMTDVPPPPEGHVYQMWFMPESGTPRSAGTMSPDTMPPPGGSVIPDLDSAVTVAVTVEPGSGSEQPTTEPVVTIPLV